MSWCVFRAWLGDAWVNQHKLNITTPLPWQVYTRSKSERSRNPTHDQKYLQNLLKGGAKMGQNGGSKMGQKGAPK